MFGAMTCYTETWLGDISHVWGDDMLYRNLVGGYLSCLGRCHAIQKLGWGISLMFGAMTWYTGTWLGDIPHV